MILRGAICRLRPWAQSDIDALPAIANNRALWRNLRDQFPHPYTRESAEWWVNHCLSNPPDLLPLAIEVDGALAGAIGLEYGVGERRHSAEIGYWLGEPFWGRGIASDALGTFCRYAFEEKNIVRLFAEVFAPNTASARVLEKNGFTREAVLHHAIFKDGEYLDAFHYARLREPR